jgi:hypothetical protein
MLFFFNAIKADKWNGDNAHTILISKLKNRERSVKNGIAL